MKKLMALFLMLASSASFAANPQDCSKKENTLAIMDCHNQRYAAADKQLNSIYSAAMKNISDAEKNKLRESQRAWLKFRDADFDLVVEANKDSGSYANIEISDFKATFVENRVKELKEIFAGPGDAPGWLH